MMMRRLLPLVGFLVASGALLGGVSAAPDPTFSRDIAPIFQRHNWQGFYFYREPVGLPRGAWIELTAAWDNSERNAKNPNRPPQPVRWGERTVDEMGHAAILYMFDDEKIDYRPR